MSRNRLEKEYQNLILEMCIRHTKDAEWHLDIYNWKERFELKL